MKLLTNAGKFIDSLVNKNAFGVSNEEKLDPRNPPWLDDSIISDVLVVKGRSRLGVSETSTEILFGWLDTLDLNDADSVDDGEIL